MGKNLDLTALATKPRPFWGNPPWRWLVYRLTWWILVPLNALWWRIKATGHESLPKDGPALVLPTHSTGLDPWILSYPLYRPMFYMASAQALKTPILGPILQAMGAFPKVKYVKDKGSMQHMTNLYENGQFVTIFPEGRRSWDGHTQTLLGGIGRTVKRMGARVVIIRMPANHFLQPRWATYPRWVPLDLEYEGPIEYPEEMPPEEITADIQARLDCTPRLRPGARTWGTRLAHGLPRFLWACPRCHTLEGLFVSGDGGNHVSCRSCGAGWRLDVETRLHPHDGGAPITVRDAFYSILSHYGDRPVQDADRFEQEQVVLREASGQVHELPRGGRSRLVAEGIVQLTPERFSVCDAQGELWGIPLADVVAISVELGSQVQVRTTDALFRVGAPGASVLKWGHFLKRWRFPDDPEPVG